MTPDEAKAINAVLDACAAVAAMGRGYDARIWLARDDAVSAWIAAGRPRVADVCECGGEIVEVCKRCGERRGR